MSWWVSCVSDVIDEDSYISTYQCPQPNTETTIQVARMSGFCVPERLTDALNDLRCVCWVLLFSRFNRQLWAIYSV